MDILDTSRIAVNENLNEVESQRAFGRVIADEMLWDYKEFCYGRKLFIYENPSYEQIVICALRLKRGNEYVHEYVDPTLEAEDNGDPIHTSRLSTLVSAFKKASQLSIEDLTLDIPSSDELSDYAVEMAKALTIYFASEMVPEATLNNLTKEAILYALNLRWARKISSQEADGRNDREFFKTESQFANDQLWPKLDSVLNRCIQNGYLYFDCIESTNYISLPKEIPKSPEQIAHESRFQAEFSEVFNKELEYATSQAARILSGQTLEFVQPQGVSMLDAALVFDSCEMSARAMVDRWQKKSLQNIGTDPNHKQGKLYDPRALIAFIKTRNTYKWPFSEAELLAILMTKQRTPRPPQTAPL